MESGGPPHNAPPLTVPTSTHLRELEARIEVLRHTVARRAALLPPLVKKDPTGEAPLAYVQVAAVWERVQTRARAAVGAIQQLLLKKQPTTTTPRYGKKANMRRIKWHEGENRITIVVSLVLAYFLICGLIANIRWFLL